MEQVDSTLFVYKSSYQLFNKKKAEILVFFKILIYFAYAENSIEYLSAQKFLLAECTPSVHALQLDVENHPLKYLWLFKKKLAQKFDSFSSKMIFPLFWPISQNLETVPSSEPKEPTISVKLHMFCRV